MVFKGRNEARNFEKVNTTQIRIWNFLRGGGVKFVENLRNFKLSKTTHPNAPMALPIRTNQNVAEAAS
jgi:intergrase/recombinase